MGVEHYDCSICGANGVWEGDVKHCICGAHICDECQEKYKDELKKEDTDDDYQSCPECAEEKEKKKKIKHTEAMLKKLLKLYNKKTKEKLTIKKLEKL